MSYRAVTRSLAACLMLVGILGRPLDSQTRESRSRALELDSVRVAHRETARATADRLLHNLALLVTAPGASAAVSAHGAVVWAGTEGWADVENNIPVSPDSRFRLASVSKLFTATLALRLIESGELDPDADVRAYVPSWPDHDGATITVRQLASHTAGINHYQSLASSDYVEGVHYPDIFESLSFFAEAPLLATPGEAYRYSSFGYALLNAVTEGATGRTLSSNLDRLIFQPLGLGSTGLEDVRNLSPEAVALYRRLDDGRTIRLEPNDQSFVWGATGMRSTPSDLVRFADAFLSAQLVSAETRDWALEPTLLNDGSPVAEDRYSIGFGWRVGEDWEGRPVAHHAGSTPGARTILLGYPDARIVVALLVNGTWTSRVETTAELLAAPFQDGVAFEAACPVGDWPVAGTFAEELARGTLVIESDAGLCVGTLRERGAMAARWGDRPGQTRTFELVRVARRGDRDVFAIAHPWGLARLWVRVEGGAIDVTGDIVGWPVRLEGAAS